MIPRRLVRTVGVELDDEVEGFWRTARELHPSWELVTHRDPLDPADWPITRAYWSTCSTGAQRAGLIRLEAIYRHGGVYVDSDLELYRPLDPLLGVAMFAGYEDARTIPDFVFGAELGHPVVADLLALAVARIDRGAWESGPGVFTEVLGRRPPGVLLLPPGSFAPYHYSEKHRRGEDHRTAQPWSFGAHHWRASWLG